VDIHLAVEVVLLVFNSLNVVIQALRQWDTSIPGSTSEAYPVRLTLRCTNSSCRVDIVARRNTK
jgi:hypothetical protein